MSRTVAAPSLDALHERLEDLHLEIANLMHELVTAPRDEIELASADPEHAQLGGLFDRLVQAMRTARQAFDQLLEAMPADTRRASLHAIAMLQRNHDEAVRDLHEAQHALVEGPPVTVRIRLARAFRAIGRAEQMHYYLRSARRPSA